MYSVLCLFLIFTFELVCEYQTSSKEAPEATQEDETDTASSAETKTYNEDDEDTETEEPRKYFGPEPRPKMGHKTSSSNRDVYIDEDPLSEPADDVDMLEVTVDNSMDENIADLDDKISNNDHNSVESGCSEMAANPNDLDTSSDMPVDLFGISKSERCISKSADEPNADSFTVDTTVVSVASLSCNIITLLFARNWTTLNQLNSIRMKCSGCTNKIPFEDTSQLLQNFRY